jgi:hypothetical protein
MLNAGASPEMCKVTPDGSTRPLPSKNPASSSGSLTMARLSHTGDYRMVSALFLRALALIYFAAFLSTGLQVVGLVGAEGILPIQETLENIAREQGPERYWFHPTLFWLDASDNSLRAVTVAGCVLSVLLFFQFRTRFSLILLYVLYLSLYHAGQIFLEFQWDYLLLESGFLAIFLPGGSRVVVWLYRWLLFRLRFVSGLAKLLSQDPTWANLTALSYFFETQPLPHWGGWYAHQLPGWFLGFGTGAALFVELVVPFLTFLPRPWRLFGAWATILMQVLILLTSNHNYANFLVLALCLFLFDDRALARIVPQRARAWRGRGLATPLAPRQTHRMVPVVLAASIGTYSTVQMADLLAGHRSPAPVVRLLRGLAPFRIASTYHAFPTMLTERIELVIEGSRDGVHWRPYEFKYKPGDLWRRPEVIVPHQPRLDYLLWFVPWHPMFLPWFERFLGRLLESSPAVLGLMARNPFPEGPPQSLRISLYRYRFTSPQERAETGRWWSRTYLGPFLPLPGLEQGG